MDSIINRIDLSPFNTLISGDVFGAVNQALSNAMGNWYWVIFGLITLVVCYIRTQSLAYTAALSLIMAMLLFELPVYAKGIVYVFVVLGVAMAMFNVFGRRDK